VIIKQLTRRYSLPRRLTQAPPSQAEPEATVATNDPMTNLDPNESMAQTLEATGNYRILRRLVPRTVEPAIAGHRIGLIVDLETTGLDTSSDEVLEIAAVKFAYADDRIISVIDTLQAFQQPSAPIPPAITALTGITNAMVEGQKIDGTEVEQFVSDVHIVIAHMADFDRKLAERFWPIFAHRHWACSVTGIDWRGHGFGGARLPYILAEFGLFHDAHRALDDCHAALEILARDLPGTSTSCLAALLDRARRPQHRLWAVDTPYALKNALKQRGYRWNDGGEGRPRSWYVDVDDLDTELTYLRREIYQRADIDIVAREITSLDRFSDRI
jgi:DNA polymerase-3 subunit epsilon